VKFSQLQHIVLRKTKKVAKSSLEALIPEVGNYDASEDMFSE
jgi:hypothetical protein